MSVVLDELTTFLIEAKRRTYAGLDDDATVTNPLLVGSKQLEYRAAPYAYRDIYFGMGFFVGQETVSKNERVFWSMCYSGGVRAEVTERSKVLSIYTFLRQALLAANRDLPYRGPTLFSAGGMKYLNRTEGNLDRFSGSEEILESGSILFELKYSGGLLR